MRLVMVDGISPFYYAQCTQCDAYTSKYWDPKDLEPLVHYPEDYDMETKHPADAANDSELTHGQRITRGLFPHLAARQDQRVCVVCAKPQFDQSSWSEAGRKEWNISGCCESCFDRLFAEED